MGLPLLFGFLVSMAMLILFYALGRLIPGRDPTAERLKQFGVAAEDMAGQGDGERTNRLPGVTRLLNGFGLGPKLADMLARADVALTAAELVLLMLAAAVLLGTAGWFFGGGPMPGLLAAAIAAPAALMYLQFRQGRRKAAFTEQLPNMLMMLVGALRAGYGLNQALASIQEQLPAPTSVELGRALRAVSLGLPITRALDEMAERAGSDDLGLVVTAIKVQHELGGNLAQTLDIISDTIRDRIRIKREITVMTSQQLATGVILALLPVALGAVLFVMNREYMQNLFLPGITRIMLIAAVVMEIAGFLVIRKILAIEV